MAPSLRPRGSSATAYSLAFAVVLIPGGRLGDILGRRKVFLVGLIVFLIMSATCAAAPNMTVLLTARVLQGVAAGLIIPQTIGLVKAMFSGPSLGRALSLIGPVMGLTAVTGPALGGLLTTADIAGLSWRAVFLVNLPLGAVVLLGARLLPEDRAARRPRIDGIGAPLVGIGCAALVVPTISTDVPWIERGGLIGVAAAVTSLLVLHTRALRRRGGDPIIEPSLFRDRGFPAALVTSMIYFSVSTGLVFVVVLYVQIGQHQSILDSSLTVLPFSLGLAVSSILAGQFLLPRSGPGLMLAEAALLGFGCLAGMAIAGFAPVHSRDFWIPFTLGVSGLGGGLVTVPFFRAALSRVKPHETGSAAGLLNSVQQLGAALGVACLGAIYLAQPGQPHIALSVVFTFSAVMTLALASTATGMLRTHGNVDQ